MQATARVYAIKLFFRYKLLRENLFLVQDNVIVGSLRTLEKGYLIFYLITDQIILSYNTMLLHVCSLYLRRKT